MRYLLHHSDAVFDPTTKRWLYTLDRRISNPRSIAISKCVFTASTTTSYPSVIYMRSDALHNMIKTKHTVELKADNHENSSNVIAVLQETHTTGRYSITERGLNLPVHGHTHVRQIDLYFTDGNTVMDGELDASAAPVIGAADDQTLVDLGSDLVCWLDMEYACLNSSSVHVDEAGDEVSFLRNRSPGTSNLFVTCSADDFVVAQFGETLSLAGGPSVSWAYAVDSSDPNFGVSAIASLHFMFKAPPTALGQGLVNLPANIFRIEWVANQLRCLTVSPVAWTYISSVTFLQNSNWYVECILTDDDGNQDGEFSWRFIDLDDPNYTEYTENTDGPPAQSSINDNWNISAANDHFTCQISHLCVLNSGGPNKRNLIRDWMLGRYAVEGGADTPAPPAPATFLVELDIKQSQR